MVDIIIRKLKNTDIDIISFLVNKFSHEWSISEKEMKEEFVDASFLGSFPYIFIAVSENGEFVGDIILSIEKDWFLGIDNEVWISGVFVVEKYRNQGIARKLISQAESVVFECGYKSLYLDTIDASGYYKKIGGWVEIGKDTWKDKEVIIMKKDLL